MRQVTAKEMRHKITGDTAAVKFRQWIELAIAVAFINQVVRSHYYISVNNGEDGEMKPTNDAKTVIEAMFLTDDEHLNVWVLKQETESEFTRIGFAYFVYGNDGFDVISDYSTLLEPLMKDADLVAAAAEDGRFIVEFDPTQKPRS